MYSLVTTRVKNDNSYLDEWVEYHLSIGFDHIVIYDNLSTEPVAPKWGDRVSVFLDHNEFRVFPPFNTHQFIIDLKRPEWLLHIDVDEFLVLYQHKSVNELLRCYENYGGLVINWRIYGSSGHVKRPEGLVKDNYIYRTPDNYVGAEGGNGVGKVAMNVKYLKGVVNPHFAVSTRDIVNEDFVKTGDGVINSSCRLCRLNHYYTRSREEWEVKVNRGNGKYFQKRGLSEIENIDKHSIILDPILKNEN
jgi:hypothetical protein